MKAKLAVGAILLFGFAGEAQFNGLLNKAKEKALQKSETKTEDKQTNKSSQETTRKETEKNKPQGGSSESASEVSNSNSSNQKSMTATQANYQIFLSNQAGQQASEFKTAFTSKEFIYAKLELKESLKSYFKIQLKNEGVIPCLNYVVRVFKDGEELGYPNPIWNNCYVKKSDLDKNVFYFDVLPDPKKATTVISPLDDFSAGKASAPLYMSISPSQFPSTGKYTVRIELYKKTYSAYGEMKPESEWPRVTQDFEFNFNEEDVELLQKNGQEANSNVKEGYSKKETEERELPDAWNKQSVASTSGYSEQQIKSMFVTRYPAVKLIKMVVLPEYNGGGWQIIKNDLGVPTEKFYRQPIAVFYSNSDASCFYMEGYVYQTYEGGGKYGNAWFYDEKKVSVACDKMK